MTTATIDCVPGPCDHPMMRLYGEAMRLCGAGRAAWAKVEEARRTREERIPEQYSPPWTEGGFDDVPRRDLWREEDEGLTTSYHAAEQAEHASTAALAEALAAAPWGAQPDGSFVTRQSTGVASGRYIHTLHAPAKQGPLAEAQDGERFGSGAYLRALRTREEARAIRDAMRASAREREMRYLETRKRAADALLDGSSLLYVPGQEWGYIRLLTGEYVSARGVLRAAGLTREEAERLLSESWERLGVSYDSGGRGLRLSLRGVQET